MTYRQRTIAPHLARLATQYPVVTLTGPRQSGKSTVCRHVFSEKPYVNLEDIETRQYALSDPKGFLMGYPKGALIDEIQYAPALLSYIQVIVDQTQQAGQFVLTGSQQFSLMAGVTQSLAGRTALATLLPFGLEEISDITPDSIESLMLTGFYPRLYEYKLNPTEASSFYLRTYVERDVRQLLHIQDLAQFERFLKFCAGRSGQMLNLSALAGDTGLSIKTIKQWLSVLEASYIVTLLPPAYENINKRLVKTQKLYFLDTGLLCYLLGITTIQQLAEHPLKGSIFETLVVAECYKQRFHQIREPQLSYYRDQQHEVDLIDLNGAKRHAIEIKSSKTFSPDFLKSLHYFKKVQPLCNRQTLVYGGHLHQIASGVRVLPFKDIATVFQE